MTLAERGRPVTVRILIGHYPTEEVDTGAFLKALTAGLEAQPKARLSISVAAMRSCVVFEDCDSYSWNHAKTVSVDGVDALVGGHNMWTLDYLLDDPVSDLVHIVTDLMELGIRHRPLHPPNRLAVHPANDADERPG